jgi:RNA polymerase sigma-70 factor (ECF subfamily)
LPAEVGNSRAKLRAVIDSSNTGFFAWVTQLVREHRTEIVGVARREGLLAEDALDAAQEALHTFLTLPHARALANHLDDSRKVLTVLVRNHARNRRRRHDRARPHISEPQVVEQLIADEESVEAVITQAEAHVQALGCVERLGEVQRRVVTLRLLEDHANEDVAALLGMTPGHVAVVLHRAKQTLRECMTAAD